MIEPIVIEPVLMRDMGDCAVCCLAMLLGKPYAEIHAAVPQRHKRRAFTTGLSVLQLCNIAKKLGIALEYHDEPEDDAVGVLILKRTVNTDYHAVMYMKGVLFHPGDGSIWTDMDSFLKQYHWKVEGFLWRTA